MNNNQRFVLMLAGMALVGIAIMRVAPAQQSSPAVQGQVVARQFVLVDGQGKPQARLEMQNEHPQLVLLGALQNELVNVSAIPGRGGVIEINGSLGQSQVVIGHGYYAFATGKTLASVKGFSGVGGPAFQDGDYWLDFYNDKGERASRFAPGSIALLGKQDNIAVSDLQGDPLVSVGVADNGEPSMILADKSGRKRTLKP